MSSFEACGIREPKAETKEILLEKSRRLAKQTAEMSSDGDSGPREYFYGASNHGTQSTSQPTPATPKFILNPESKAFVPPNRTPSLNVNATPFIPRQLMAPPPTEGAAAVTTEMGALSVVGIYLSTTRTALIVHISVLFPSD